MLPLVVELSGGAFDPGVGAHWPHFSAVEGIATRLGLCEYATEVGVDRGLRGRVRLEPKKLGVLAIAFGVTAKHCTSQKRFAP